VSWRGGARAVGALVLWTVLLAAYIGIVYGVVVLGGGWVLSIEGDSTGLTIAAAAVVAVSFPTVRRRAKEWANHLVLGSRTSSLETLHHFSQGVAGAYGADEVLSGMAHVLAEGTGARRAEVWVVVGEELRRGATWPAAASLPGEPPRPVDEWPDASTGIDLCVPVQLETDLLGLLALASRSGRPFTAAEENLVADLASHASHVLQNVRLSAELAARSDDLATQTADLRESRRRLVSARTAERRRVERNIHDGAQQHLVALLVRIGLLPVLAETDEERAASELNSLHGLCDEALATLADLARGLHPRELTEDGLAAALSARVARVPEEIRTSVEADGLGRHPSDIEAAAYFACLEAVQNAVKYSQCSSIVLRLAEEAGALSFSVSDDGIGFDRTRVALGAGMTNMADRIEALNGTLEVRSAPSAGTTVTGRLPSSALAPTP
jgi:signal transduction histidine kinase